MTRAVASSEASGAGSPLMSVTPVTAAVSTLLPLVARASSVTVMVVVWPTSRGPTLFQLTERLPRSQAGCSRVEVEDGCIVRVGERDGGQCRVAGVGDPDVEGDRVAHLDLGS